MASSGLGKAWPMPETAEEVSSTKKTENHLMGAFGLSGFLGDSFRSFQMYNFRICFSDF